MPRRPDLLRLVAIMRRRPCPDPQQPFDAGSIEAPAFHVGRVDADGSAVIQLLVGNVVATSARLTPDCRGANHWWVDSLHTLDGYLDHNRARTDSERQMTREAYDAIHNELTQAEHAQERLEADLVLRGIANEDNVASALRYLDRFDRFLNQLPPDQLRRTFDALGVRLDVRFQANPDPKSRRQRVPVGGTMSFGTKVVGRYHYPGNDSSPAGAEDGSESDETWLGCGGPEGTQCSWRLHGAAMALRGTVILFELVDFGQVCFRRKLRRERHSAAG